MRTFAMHLARIVLGCAFLISAPISAAAALTAKDDALAVALMREGVATPTLRAVIHTEPGELTPQALQDFARLVEVGIAEIEKLMGRSFDSAHFGQTPIRVFVHRSVMPSHVYGGYHHAAYDKPYVYLPLQFVQRGGSPYLHELAHVLAWNYGSHTLREGLANHVMYTVAAAGKGRNSSGQGFVDRAGADNLARQALNGAVGARFLASVGAAGIPESDLTSGRNRNAYYAVATSFSIFVLEALDMSTFMRLYEAPDPESAFLDSTGKSLEAWKQAWLAYLGTAQ